MRVLRSGPERHVRRGRGSVPRTGGTWFSHFGPATRVRGATTACDFWRRRGRSGRSRLLPPRTDTQAVGPAGIRGAGDGTGRQDRAGKLDNDVPSVFD